MKLGRQHNYHKGQAAMLTNLPVYYDLCIGVPAYNQEKALANLQIAFVSKSSPDPTLGNMNRMETIVQQPGRAGRASNCI